MNTIDNNSEKVEAGFLPYAIGAMKQIAKVGENGPTVAAAWSIDNATKKRRLQLVLIYEDGEFSPIHEYPQGKLMHDKAKALADLADMDGIDEETVQMLYKQILKCHKDLDVQAGGEGKCSIRQVHKELSAYVREYKEPDKVYVGDGYGYIRSSYLPKVLDRLELGYNRLEVEKNFKAFGLLRASEKSGHPYSLGVNKNGRTEWFVSFKLAEDKEETAA